MQISLSRMGDKRGVSSDEIEVDADKDLVLVRKKIFKHAAFDRIKSLDSEIRRYVRDISFPFESGLHMVAKPTATIIDQKLQNYETMRYEFIDTFSRNWGDITKDFPEKLRKLWNANDYNVGDIRSNFSMHWNFIELRVPLELEQVNSELFKTEQRKWKQRMEEAYEEARMLLRETCLELVKHLNKSLEPDMYGAAKRISSSTVEKLKTFVNTFDLRNITNDHELQTMAKRIRELLGNVNADTIRNYTSYREDLHDELTGIEHQLEKATTVMPTRRIKF